MKRFLSAAAAVLLMSGAASAQSVNFGIKGGANFSTIEVDNGFDYKTKTGYHGGLLAHIHLAPQFALQPEIVYSRQGTLETIGNVENKVHFDYINVPVMMQYMFDYGFRLQAGPQVGFLVNAKRENGNNDINIKNELKTVDFGIGAGVGYVHVPSGFGVDARYNLGLSDISETSALKTTNRGFQVGVFYMFKHKD